MPLRVRESDRSRGTPKRDSEKEGIAAVRSGHKAPRRKSSRKSQDKTADGASYSSTSAKKRSSMPEALDPETVATRTGLEARSSVPYPEFSKAHSKEAVGSREALQPTLNLFTPDPTDLDASKENSAQRDAAIRGAPPSPPLTSVDQNEAVGRNAGAKQSAPESREEERKKTRLDKTVKIKLRPRSSKSRVRTGSGSELSSPEKAPRSAQSPLKNKLDGDGQRSTSLPSKATCRRKPSTETVGGETTTSSNATSIAPHQPKIQRSSSRPQVVTVEDDVHSQVTSIGNGGTTYGRTPVEVFSEENRRSPAYGMAQHPPPPPPPPLAPISQPRVDYLLQHGGLSQPVPKSLLLAGKSMAYQPVAAAHQSHVVAKLFEPYGRLLDDYKQVVSKNGSLAVATGSRSVARRLLDRLEAVFARDISAESCQCDMCAISPNESDDAQGFSWGEILELVSGRRDLPSWPPFSLATNPQGLGISLENHVPMQKMDIDVPEEYRKHYIRQSQKTKQRVDKWLLRQDASSSSPPGEVDDETLTFAILTHLTFEQRSTFSNLLGLSNMPLGQGPQRIPSPQRGPTPQPAPTPEPRHRSEPVVAAGRAIQRLYRLGLAPRDPETAIYLLNNPDLHNALATLAAVSDDEWYILISGRFDGFLRSGAEEPASGPTLPGRQTPLRAATSRGPTPLHGNRYSRTESNPSRVATPVSGAHYGAPIAYDEEMEVATLAEIERDIYTGMEALEDAFEVLHVKAETVRQALRERGAGLAAVQQRRKSAMGDHIEVRMNTPAGGVGGDGRWETETDDGLGDWDGSSELAPDDSASNISSSRRRRPKRRNERRTPALVEEEEIEEEDFGESDGTTSPRKK